MNDLKGTKSRNLTIARSLTVSLILIVVIVSAIAMGFNYWYSSVKARAHLEEKADEYMEFLTDTLAIPIWTYEVNTVHNIGSFFAKNELVAALRIRDNNLTVFFEMEKEDEIKMITREQPVFFKGNLVGDILLSLSSEYHTAISHSLLRSSAITILMVLISLIVMTGLLLRFFLRKTLNELSRIVNAYTVGKYEFSENSVLYSEFEPLVKLLKKMANEIQTQIKELSEAEKKYRNIFENAVDGIFQTTLDGRLINANPALNKIMGYDYGEEFYLTDIGKQVYANPDDRENIIQRLKYEGKVSGYETEMVRKDKTLVRVSISVREVRNEQGDLLYFEGLLTDITERIKREKAEREREIAESASQAKSVFLASMSHEIRTPMNGVIGMTGLLLDTALTKDQRLFAENIRYSAESLLTIINDVLDFSKIEAGQLELEKTPFNLRECVESAMDLVALKAGEKGIELACVIAPNLPIGILSDQTRLRQILLNLLSNAVKFTHHGQIIVTVECCHKSDCFESPDGYHGEILFSVKDTGIGIPADYMNRLFKSFSQLDSSTTRKYGGTGLGLAISKRLTEMMGGKIWVESVEGAGTTFSFSISAPPAKVPQPVYLSPHQPSLAGKQVLIVDDNAINREILLRQTIIWEMKPVAFSSGAEALQAIRSEKQFDLALLDMQMPAMDGLELARQLHQLTRADSFPVVIMSSAGLPKTLITDPNAQPEAAQLNLFTTWLLKPIKASQLYNVLIELFEKNRAQGEHDDSAESEYDPQMASRHPLKILVAEDNFINQQLALFTLERFGYRADIADNGLEVLKALHRQFYDVILMDIQMPELDGLDAAKQIRREIPAERQPRIIAMTANALQGDREKCLNAGMDDYISKPFTVKELIQALNKALCRDGKTAAKTLNTDNNIPNSTPSDNQILDPKAIKRLLSIYRTNAEAKLPKLIDDLFRDSVKQQQLARQALADNSPPNLLRAMHSLKSNLKTFGANTLAELCQQAEDQANIGQLEHIPELLSQIETDFKIVKIALETLQNSLSSA